MTEPLYKVKFIQQEVVVELIAKYISEESLMGFIEIEDIIFPGSGEPFATDEKYREEFFGIERCYLPLHTLLRIDELSTATEKVVGEVKYKKNNVRRIPLRNPPPNNNPDEDKGL